jgi:hypothetical protein
MNLLRGFLWSLEEEVKRLALKTNALVFIMVGL